MSTTKPTETTIKSRPRGRITTPFEQLPDEALVDKSVVFDVTGYKSSAAYQLMSEGRFPKPLKLGSRCSRWRVGELRKWLADPIGYSQSKVGA